MKSTRCPQARWRLTVAFGLAAAVTLCASGTTVGPAPSPSRAERRPTVAAIPEKPKVNPSFGNMPICFEPNVGQAPAGVRFVTRGSAASLTATGAVLGGGERPVTLEFVGASASARAAGARELPGKANYLVGNDPSEWKTNVPTYSAVCIEQLYEGVDLVWYGKGRSLEYDLVVSPGADPDSIAFELEGFPSPELEADGALVAGSVRLERPFAYQEIGGARRSVASRYAVRDSGRVAFELGDYDRSFPLVIDPEIGYSFSLAESTKDIAVSGIAVDQTGAAYVVGSSAAAGTGARDVYIAKLNPEGTALVYSTTIGGSRYDLAYDVAVDDAGNAFVTGETASSDFPTTAGAFQPTFASTSPGDADAVVLKLAPDGDTLVYASFLGGAKFDHGKDIVIDAPGNAYVTGTTTSMNFPTTEPEQAGNGGLADAFMTIVNPTGSAKVASTYLGGSDSDNGEGIALDASGNVYVVGATSSMNFPVSPGALQPTFGGGVIDGFWAKYDPTGNRAASTYLGGSGVDVARAVDVDSAGNSYVTGETDVTDFPGVSPVQEKVKGGSRDAFVAGLNPAGTNIGFSISFGGSQYESGNAIVINSGGLLSIAGETYSSDLPLTDPVQLTFGGGISDAFLLQCDPNAPGPEAIEFCTYIGDERTNFGVDCGVGPNDEVCVASTSPDLSPDGTENDESVVTQFEQAVEPRAEITVGAQPLGTSYSFTPAVVVTITTRSGTGCALPPRPTPLCQNVNFGFDIPSGSFLDKVVYRKPGVNLIEAPPPGQPGRIEFEYLNPVPFDGVFASVQLAFPAIHQLEFSSRAFAETERSPSVCRSTASTEFKFRVSPQVGVGQTSLQINAGTPAPAGSAPRVSLIRDLSSPGNSISAKGSPAGSYNVYSSTQPNVQPVPQNLFKSVPADIGSVDVSSAPGGSYFVVTAVSDSGESPPSNEVGGQLPTIDKLKVSSSKIVAQGAGFTTDVQVYFGGLPFAIPPKLKRGNTKVIQKGLFISGLSINDLLNSVLGAGSVTVLLLVNGNGNGVAVEYTR